MSASYIKSAVATSIESEVAEPDWTVNRFDPLFRNPENGKQLFVYCTTRRPASFERGFQTTGSRRDAYEVVVEYVESADDQVQALERQEEPELEADDVADSIVAWADTHKSLGTGANTFDLDFVEARYAPDVAREFLVRYVRCTFQARRAHAYG